MNDPDDIEFKSEINKIMRNVHNIIKKIETVNPTKDDDLEKNKD